MLGFVEVLAADSLLEAGRINTAFAVIRWLWFIPGLLVLPWVITYEARFNDSIAPCTVNPPCSRFLTWELRFAWLRDSACSPS